jgi:hypothetical protein
MTAMTHFRGLNLFLDRRRLALANSRQVRKAKDRSLHQQLVVAEIRAPEDDHLHPVTSIIRIHRPIRLVTTATP